MEDNNEVFPEDEIITIPESDYGEDLIVEQKPKKSMAQEIFDWVEVMAFSLACILIIFTYLGRLAVVDGSSMRNTLTDGETLLISKALYEPEQGDIIVFQIPDGKGTLGQPLIKRIIATEGQTVYIDCQEWKTYVYNDADMPIEKVLETVTPFETMYEVDINYEDTAMKAGYGIEYPYTVPEGKLFVMGDNRNASSDSRIPDVGPVDERYILGKAYYRLLPFDKIGEVH